MGKILNRDNKYGANALTLRYKKDRFDLLLKDKDIRFYVNGVEIFYPYGFAELIFELRNGGSLYNNSNESTATNLEGFPVGTTFENKTIKEMLDTLLYPYQLPSFETFTINVNPTIEVGTSIPLSKFFTWSTNYSENVEDNSIRISYLIDDTIYVYPDFLEDGFANDGSETIVGDEDPLIVSIVPGNQTFSISGSNTNGGTFTKDVIINWKYKIFYGVTDSAPIDSESIRELPNYTFDTNSFSININDNVYSIAIPSTKSLVSVITSFPEDITDNFVETSVDLLLPDNETTVSYKVYTLTTILPLNLTATVTLE